MAILLQQSTADPSGWIALLVLAITGRSLLAWLPPGNTGSHDLRAWPITWAACHLLGRAAQTTVGLQTFELSALLWGAVPLLLLRWASLPGDLVPLLEPAGAPGSPATRPSLPTQSLRLLVVAAWLYCMSRWIGTAFHSSALAYTSGAGRLLAAGDLSALFVLLTKALRHSHKLPGESWLALSLWSLWLLSTQLVPALTHSRALLFAGGAAALALTWWRRAERRDLVLAVIALCSLRPLFWAPLVALVATAPSASRAWVLRLCLVGALVASPSFLKQPPLWLPNFDQWSEWLPRTEWRAFVNALRSSAPTQFQASLSLLGLTCMVAAAFGRTRQAQTLSSQPERLAASIREQRGLLWLLLLSYLGMLLPSGTWSQQWSSTHLILSPAWFLLMSLVLLRSDQVHSR